MTWTRFMDMHSGGGLKESPFNFIFIEAPEAEAEVIFYNRFGHNPNRVSCTCCGEDYGISEGPTLESATGYDRGCEYVVDAEGSGYVEKPSTRDWSGPYQTLPEYLENNKDTVLVVKASEITSEDRKGELEPQGYVWVD